MQVQDMNAVDLAALTGQGYTESDISLLGKTEIEALLAYSEDDDEAGTTGDDIDAHRNAADEQDQANSADAPTNTSSNDPFVPTYTAEVPDDAVDQIKALKTEEQEAFKKLMAGEIEPEAYQEVKERTESAVDELKTKALTASIFSQANEQSQKQIAAAEWNKATANAFAMAKADGVDYQAKPALLSAYNFNLKALGEDPKNENRDAAWFLSEAHRVTKADLGIVTAKNVAPQSTNRVERSELPPTLRSVPAAATNAVNADEFAHMRNLKGVALEKAHAAMTEAQRDRWMAE